MRASAFLEGDHFSSIRWSLTDTERTSDLFKRARVFIVFLPFPCSLSSLSVLMCVSGHVKELTFLILCAGDQGLVLSPGWGAGQEQTSASSHTSHQAVWWWKIISLLMATADYLLSVWQFMKKSEPLCTSTASLMHITFHVFFFHYMVNDLSKMVRLKLEIVKVLKMSRFFFH